MKMIVFFLSFHTKNIKQKKYKKEKRFVFIRLSKNKKKLLTRAQIDSLVLICTIRQCCCLFVLLSFVFFAGKRLSDI